LLVDGGSRARLRAAGSRRSSHRIVYNWAVRRGPAALLSPLLDRPFMFFFWARVASLVGDKVNQVALAFAVLDLTESAADLGFVLAARTATMVVFLLAAGVWADRVPRHALMIVSDLARAATQATLATLFITGAAELWQVITLSALNGVATAMFSPAADGLLPQLVPGERLQRANGILALAFSVGGLVGPALGGLAVVAVGPGWGLAIDSLTFVVSAAFLLGLGRLRGRVTAKEPGAFVRELRDGWRELTSRTWLWTSIVYFGLFNALSASFDVLGPVIARRSLGGAAAWAAILTGLGVGSILGAAVALRWHPLKPLMTQFALLALYAAAPLLVAAGAPLPVIVGAAIIGGVGFSISAVLWETVFGENIPERALSRVSSYDWLGSMTLRPIGFAILGPVAVAIGAPLTMGLSFVAIALMSIAMLGIRDVRELPRRSTVVAEPVAAPAPPVGP
jgi:MFS family permease